MYLQEGTLQNYANDLWSIRLEGLLVSIILFCIRSMDLSWIPVPCSCSVRVGYYQYYHPVQRAPQEQRSRKLRLRWWVIDGVVALVVDYNTPSNLSRGDSTTAISTAHRRAVLPCLGESFSEAELPLLLIPLRREIAISR
jgi:hypothetical protein